MIIKCFPKIFFEFQATQFLSSATATPFHLKLRFSLEPDISQLFILIFQCQFISVNTCHVNSTFAGLKSDSSTHQHFSQIYHSRYKNDSRVTYSNGKSSDFVNSVCWPLKNSDTDKAAHQRREETAFEIKIILILFFTQWVNVSTTSLYRLNATKLPSHIYFVLLLA